MPGCAAVYCSSPSEKGFLMKHFPRGPDRRKQWQIKTMRDSWTPSGNSYLRETHFAAKKIRVDGTRAPKWKAVPTIFSFSELNISRKV
nr:unnamed protein product [Callosobruchus analis]